MAFWKRMPISVYQSWTADKIRKKGEEIKKRLAHPVDAIEDALQGAAQGAGTAFDVYNRNVVDPIAGYGQATGITAGNVARSTPAGALLDIGEAAGIGNPLPRRDADLDFRSWAQSGEKFRDTPMSGAERLGSRALADPLTYVGGYSKAAGAVPGIGKALGPAVGAIEKLPGRGEQAAAKGIAKGVGSLIPDALKQPSIGSQARAAGQDVYTAVRQATGDFAGNRFIKPGTQATSAGALRRSHLQARRALAQDPRLAPILNAPVETTLQGGSTARGRVGDLLTEAQRKPGQSTRATKLQPQDFATRTAGLAVDEKIKELRGIIRQKRDAEIAGGGVKALKARAQDFIQDKYAGSGIGFGKSFRVNPAAINREVSTAALGTPGYAIGNVEEDITRPLVSGYSGRTAGGEEFLRGVENVSGVPQELVTGGGQTLAMTGGRDTFKSKVLDALTGRYNIRMAEQGGMPARRGMFLEALERGRTLARRGEEVATPRPQRGINRPPMFPAGQRRPIVFDDTAVPVPEAPPPPRTALSDEEVEIFAANFALDEFKKVYPNYMDETVGDAFMKAIYPFWTYQKHRYPWLARTWAEQPGKMMAQERVRQEGDIQLPDIPTPFGDLQTSDFEINPTKGTVFNTPAGLSRPDYPSFAQGPSGAVEGAFDASGRLGFFPGPLAQGAAALGRGLTGEDVQPGQLVPGAVKVPLQAAAAAGMGSDIRPLEWFSETVNNFMDTAMDDRFRQYYINKELAAMGVVPSDATPEQRAEAEQRTAFRQALLTEVGTLRWRPSEEREFRDRKLQLAIEAGVPEDVAREAAKRGNPLSAVTADNIPYLDDATKREAYAQIGPEMDAWQQVGDPLMSEERLGRTRETRGYFDRLNEIDARSTEELATVHGRYQSGVISGEQMRDQRGEILGRARNERQALKGEYQRRGALVTEEERDAFYAESGQVMLGDTPQDRAARTYYDIELEKDPLTGEPLYDEYYARREQALAALDPETRQYVTERYPRDKYKDNPLVAEGEAQYRADMAEFQQYMDMPKYLGIPKEREEEMDRAAELLSYLRDQHPDADTRTLRAMVARVYPNAAWLASYASRLQNPERERFFSTRPSLSRLMSGATGREIAGVGL
ncbi:MAG: hypothetical protein AB7Q01_08390 [Gammaproteobacteria bacterium]